MRSDLEKLIELQITDTELRRLKNIIETAESKRAEVEHEFEQHASSIREIQNRAESLKSDRVALERQVSDNKVYKERAERNLKHAQNQKEYEASMREIDVLQKQITTLETQVLEKMTELEEVEKVLAERADEISGHDAKRDAALTEFDTSVTNAKDEFEKRSVVRAEVFATVAPQLASVYNRLAQRSRDGIAVAEVINGSCSACFMSLRPQMNLEVKRMDSIVTCESCTRILYIVSQESKAATPDA